MKEKIFWGFGFGIGFVLGNFVVNFLMGGVLAILHSLVSTGTSL